MSFSLRGLLFPEGPNSKSEAPTTNCPWSPPILTQRLPHPRSISTWTFMNNERFSDMQSHQLASIITIVTTISTRVDRAIIVTWQFRPHKGIHVRYIRSFFSQEKGIASLILKAHPHAMLIHSQLPSARFCHHQIHRQFLFAGHSCHPHYWFSRSGVLWQYHTGVHNLNCVFSRACSDMDHPRSSSSRLWLVWYTVSRFSSTTHKHHHCLFYKENLPFCNNFYNNSDFFVFSWA